MTWSFRVSLRCSASMLCIALFAGHVKAQQIVLEGIVIQGETVERSVQESSTSTTVVTGEELDQSSSTNLYDVLELTPGVTSSFGDKGFSIRGVDQRGAGGAIGGSLLINTIVDGVSLPSNQATFFGPYSTWDMEQIEILRGPQSTQQGRNALAGAIVLRTADPFHGQEFKIRQDFETLDGARTAAAVNMEVVKDLVSFRVAGETYRSDGHVENPTLGIDDYDPRDLKNIRSKILLTPTDKLKFIYGYSYTDNRGGEDNISTASYPENRYNFSNLLADEGSKHKIHNLRGEYIINDIFTLKSETSFYNHDYNRIEDFDATASDAGFLARNNDDKSFTQETKLAFQNDWIKGAFGIFYTDIEVDSISAAEFDAGFITPTLAGIDINTDFGTNIKTQNLAFLGEADINMFGTPWTLTLGGRYDREEQDQSDFRNLTESSGNSALQALLENALGPNSSSANEASFEAFLPKAGLSYNWTPDIKTGVVVQKGYRSGGVQQNLITGQINEYDPEFTWNYELYQRTQLFNNRLTINANVFYTAWTDMQVEVLGQNATSDFDTNVVNAGKAEGYGGEISIAGQITDELNVFASYAYAKNRFIEFDQGDGNDFSGNKFPFSSEHAITTGAKYKILDGALKGFTASFDVSYMSGQETLASNDPAAEISSRIITNAAIGYEADYWALSLYGRNIFDEDYETQKTTDGSSVRAGEPRVIGITARAKF